jgi:hypothetical protein
MYTNSFITELFRLSYRYDEVAVLFIKISRGACPEQKTRFLTSFGMTGEGLEMTSS